ncbi:hypothetical protein JI739_09155 [Ramlibacter sp. AW1]|uniref:Uncharacterized protein n=1 Tax=Ramlibacter aurantiacus TaxID=2801330 RepID=A0A936ZGI5_9BURK|nr:hypothetical protein [Ramlibacter aurantiacus]MBL0420507.1 hypothetical protein [Ramlibacter aurantiacus]
MPTKKQAGAKALAVDDLLAGLELAEQTGALVSGFEFTAKDRQALGAWLDDQAIDVLQAHVEVALSVEDSDAAEPTIGESRAILQRIEVLARALAKAMEQAPSIAAGHLEGARYAAGLPLGEQMARDLQQFAAAVGDRIDSMPKQSQRTAGHTFLVSGIASIAERAGINVTASESAPFHDLCECVFRALRIKEDSRGSIRAYLRSR